MPIPRSGRPRPGPAPVPLERRRLLGNPGKRTLPRATKALAPVLVLEPVHHSATGAELVQGLLDAGASAWVSRTDQLGLLRLLAEGWDERRELRRNLSTEPMGSPSATRLRRDLRDLERQITTWLSLLGLTPADRGRLGVAEVRAQSALDRIRTNRGRAG